MSDLCLACRCEQALMTERARAEKAEARAAALEREVTVMEEAVEAFRVETPGREHIILLWQRERLFKLLDAAKAHIATLEADLSAERARAEKAEARVTELEARWAELRALYERERDYWNGPDVGYAPAVNPAAQAKRAQEILDVMDTLSTPADVVRVVVAYDDCGTEQLEFEEPTGVEYRKDDVLYIVRRKP